MIDGYMIKPKVPNFPDHCWICAFKQLYNVFFITNIEFIRKVWKMERSTHYGKLPAKELRLDGRKACLWEEK